MNEQCCKLTGGCQCGAVRYAASAVLDNAHLCHCRMCQKATGNLFAALVAVPRNALAWTRGEPARFRSSKEVDRGFCAACGTPLFYDDLTGARINLTIGSLDNPAAFKPLGQCGTEARVPWFNELGEIPDTGETEQGAQAEWAAAIKASSVQHPDHDTEIWPQV